MKITLTKNVNQIGKAGDVVDLEPTTAAELVATAKAVPVVEAPAAAPAAPAKPATKKAANPTPAKKGKRGK